MFAVIKTGAKQYIVSPGQKLKVEKLHIEEGESVDFTDVLMVEDNGKLDIGRPNVKDVKVMAKVIKNAKGKKIMVTKYKSKSRYSVTKNHRQHYTEVEILSIGK